MSVVEAYVEVLKRGRRITVGVCGGSGSGKTTLARELMRTVGPHLACVLAQDAYYIDQSARFDGDGGSVNFDHPSSLDFGLLADHLRTLRDGGSIDVPTYDFSSHRRLKTATPFLPTALIIVDGTLILDSDDTRPLLDVKVFVECPEPLRFQRRLERDVHERGRTPEGVHAQFSRQVKPMHDTYVDPSKHHADLRLSGTDSLAASVKAVLDLVVQRSRGPHPGGPFSS